MLPSSLLVQARSLPHQAWDYFKSLPTRYSKLQRTHKALIWLLVVLHVVGITGIVVIGPAAIGAFFTRLAERLQSMGFLGYLIVGSMIALATIPPFFGFASALTFNGFTFGLWPGIPIAFAATLTGSSIAFFIYRFVLRRTFKKAMGGSARAGGKWEAFLLVVKSKSLPLLIALRWCPLPFALSNAWFASLESVSYLHFITATTCMLPRLILVIFVGSRLDNLTDGERGQKEDWVSLFLNIGSIMLAVSVSFMTGLWIYNSLLDHLPKSGDIEGLDGVEDGLVGGEGDALLLHFSDADEDDEPLAPSKMIGR